MNPQGGPEQPLLVVKVAKSLRGLSLSKDQANPERLAICSEVCKDTKVTERGQRADTSPSSLGALEAPPSPSCPSPTLRASCHVQGYKAQAACSSLETWIVALKKATAVLPSSFSWGRELAQILLSWLSSEEPLPLLQPSYRKDKGSCFGGVGGTVP